MRGSPIKYGLGVACGLLVVCTLIADLAGCTGFLSFRSGLDAALTPSPSGRSVECAWSFPFQESRCMVCVEIDGAELTAADRVPTGAVFSMSGWLRRRYVSELVRAQAASPVIKRLAAEVLARGRGVCTDKSLLLGSLLVHEGYDTVLWVFSTQRHVALGVASDAARAMEQWVADATVTFILTNTSDRPGVYALVSCGAP